MLAIFYLPAKLLRILPKRKFDASIDIAVRLGVDPKQANQMVRGVATLPHGTGKAVSGSSNCNGRQR